MFSFRISPSVRRVLYIYRTAVSPADRPGEMLSLSLFYSECEHDGLDTRAASGIHLSVQRASADGIHAPGSDEPSQHLLAL